MKATGAVRRLVVGTFVLVSLAGSRAHAGGGPANTMVLVNGSVPEGVKLGEHYARLRDLPPGHVCTIMGLPPDAATYPDFYIDAPTYEAKVAKRLDACLAALPHPDEIDVLVTTKDLPWTVRLEPPYTTPSGYVVGFESLLQIHRAKRASDGHPLAGEPQFYLPGAFWLPTYLNPAFVGGTAEPGDYEVFRPYGAETWYTSATRIVRMDAAPPAFHRKDAGKAVREKIPGVPDETYDYAGNLFIVARLDAFTFAEAEAVVDRGVAADGAMPKAEISCMAAEDDARGLRDPECEFAARHLAKAGFDARYIAEFDGDLKGHALAALFTGAANFKNGITGNTYAPGAFVSSLTSAGNVSEHFWCAPGATTCPAREEQTSNARFLRAGATAVFGTVTEPTSYAFVQAGALLHYTMGYALGESVLFNVRHVYWQGQLVGDPLTTPYDVRPAVEVRVSDDRRKIAVSAAHVRGIARTMLYVEGRRVADAAGTVVETTLDTPLADKAHVLGVAIANNGSVDRPGWPSAKPLARTDTQGWSSKILPWGAGPPDAGAPDGAPADGGGDGAPGAGSPDSGCACRIDASNGSAPTAWLALLAAIAIARRRRSAVPVSQALPATAARSDRRSRASGR